MTEEHEQTDFSRCIDEVRALVEMIPDDETRGQYELEARLGRRKAKTFACGVHRHDMDAWIGMLQSSAHLTGTNEWLEHHDVFFTHDNRSLRSRVMYDSDEMQISVQHIHKQVIGHVDLKNLNHQEYDIRISLKREVPVDVSELPPATNPEFVRIQQRREFHDLKQNWLYSFSMSWCGATFQLAEQSQNTSDPIYEVECELANHATLSEKSALYVATAVCMKISDFLSRTTFVSADTGSKIQH